MAPLIYKVSIRHADNPANSAHTTHTHARAISQCSHKAEIYRVCIDFEPRCALSRIKRHAIPAAPNGYVRGKLSFPLFLPACDVISACERAQAHGFERGLKFQIYKPFTPRWSDETASESSVYVCERARLCALRVHTSHARLIVNYFL